MRTGFFSGEQSNGERQALVKKTANEMVFDFKKQKDTKKLAELVKANSNRGWGAVGKGFYLFTTATTIVALNTRSLMNLQVGENIISNCTNGTALLVNATVCGVEKILFSEALGDFFPVFAALLGFASFCVAVLTRFNSVATHHDGLKADLKKKNRPLSNDEDNFFRIANQELPVITAVYETEQIWIKYSSRILQGQAYSNFNYIKYLLKGIYGDRVEFTDGDLPTEETQKIAVLHIAPSSEGELPHARDYAVYRRLNLHTFIFCGFAIHSRRLTPWSLWDFLYLPAKVLKSMATQIFPNSLMLSSIFSSMVKFSSLSHAIDLSRSDLSPAIRWPGFIISSGAAYIRTMINSKFKGVGTGEALEIFVNRISTGRWPKILKAALAGTLIVCVVCFIYGWANALDFSLQGLRDFGFQLENLIPILKGLFSGNFLNILGLIGSVYQDMQAIFGGAYYFVQGFRELYRNFYRWFYQKGREERKRIFADFTPLQKVLFYAFGILNLLDVSAYGLNTFYFAQSAGNSPKLLNFLWYFAQFSKTGYLAFSLVLAVFNFIQNFVFQWDKAAGSFKSFANFTPIRIENIDSQLGEGLREVNFASAADGSSSSDGEGGVHMKPGVNAESHDFGESDFYVNNNFNQTVYGEAQRRSGKEDLGQEGEPLLLENPSPSPNPPQ